MLKLAFVFFVLSLAAGFLGFSGLSNKAPNIAGILFLAAASVVCCLTSTRRRVRGRRCNRCCAPDWDARTGLAYRVGFPDASGVMVCTGVAETT